MIDHYTTGLHCFFRIKHLYYCKIIYIVFRLIVVFPILFLRFCYCICLHLSSALPHASAFFRQPFAYANVAAGDLTGCVCRLPGSQRRPRASRTILKNILKNDLAVFYSNDSSLFSSIAVHHQRAISIKSFEKLPER